MADNEQLNDEEAGRRMDAAVKRALNTPPKPRAKAKVKTVEAKEQEHSPKSK